MTTELFVKMTMDRWNASLRSCDTLLAQLSDNDLQQAIAPGKNRGIYLLGHLIAVHDDMLLLLDLGEKMYPDLFEPCVKMPDREDAVIPDAQSLRSAWTNQCAALEVLFNKFTAEQWFEKHTAVTAEDFLKEPHRNKLNIVVTRTSHLQYHLGQLRLLK
jgi:hypothetical protein